MPNADIEATLARLDKAVAQARIRNPRLALFGALYRQTTQAVGRGIDAGAFDDGERMGRFVARFAGRYLDALQTAAGGGLPSRSWRMAFAAAERTDRVILQHLILGINAHINLDLGIVAAEIAPGDAIAGLQADFGRINDVLGRLAPPVQDCLGRFSPLLHVLFKVSGTTDDEVLNFSFTVARGEAWSQAVTLAHLDPAVVPLAIASLDRKVAVLGKLVADPGGVMEHAVDVVAFTESHDIAAVVDALGKVELPLPS
jgi:hypothetical protein